MELHILNYIKTNGLEKAISDFSLIYKDYGHKFLLKYNTIESNKNLIEVQECRGLILYNDLSIASLPFIKFFNIQEGAAAKIDLSTASILKKEDGSFIHYYYDKITDKWCVGTTGTAEGEGEVNDYDITFAKLFENTICKYYKNIEEFNSVLDKNIVYFFEMCTPYNIIVTQHKEFRLVSIGARNLSTLTEYSFDEIAAFGLNIPIVESYHLKDYNEIVETFNAMTYQDEGYVALDANFNRVKIKNPAYIAAHHIKGSVTLSKLLDVVKTGEIDEMAAVFPDLYERLSKINASYNKLLLKLENGIAYFNKYIPVTNKKEYAELVFKYCLENDIMDWSGLYFMLGNGKLTCTLKEYMCTVDNKKILKYI